MYRPTVRYADEYKTYIDELFRSTTLDRNQILRCALFAAAHSKEFHQIISHFQRKDVPTPSPGWSLGDWRWWRFQDVKKVEGMDVNALNSGKTSDEKNGTAGDAGRGSYPKRNEPLQGTPIPRASQGRIRPVASKGGMDVIRGTGGGITIKLT
ncbi:hypothetical protein ACWA2C_28210 [Priestia megaterium]